MGADDYWHVDLMVKLVEEGVALGLLLGAVIFVGGLLIPPATASGSKPVDDPSEE